jgi:regulator of protease activity HflC (stomatin/prohibitin superfamily)
MEIMKSRLSEQLTAATAVLAAAALAADVLLLPATGLRALGALVPWLVSALALCLFLALRIRLNRLAAEEIRDRAAAPAGAAGASLFGADEEAAEPFSMQRSAEQFERWAVPLAAPALALYQGLAAWRLLAADAPPEAPGGALLLAAAFLFGQSFLLFLFNRTLLGLGRAPHHRLLRGVGLYAGLACLASLAAGAAAALEHLGAAGADRAVRAALAWGLAALAAENAAAAVASIYRPRRRDRIAAAYESRLAALLTDPASWARNVAQALDYQFGFDVSETWLYRFLRGALAPLLLFQLAVLYFLSCLVFLGPSEEGLLERFGRPVDGGRGAGHLGPGFHVKWPWPFETVRRFPARRILHTYIGYEAEHPGESLESMLWTRPHYKSEDNFLVASREVDLGEQASRTTVPVNVLAINVPIEYRITNLVQYAYGYSDPDRVLRQIAYRGLTRATVSRGLFDLVGEGRQAAAGELRRRIQERASEMGLGLSVEFVGLQGVHPPVALADAFEAVIGADEEREATILQATAYAGAVLPRASAESNARVFEAEGVRDRRVALSGAEADAFALRLQAHRESPRVFRSDAYLRAIRDGLATARAIVVTARSSNEVIRVNLEEKIRPDLFDLGPEPGGPNS